MDELEDAGFAERYRAIDARDSRFDGQFFTAVTSTGIYCRPSCPARTPKAQNVRFYSTSAAAHEAGFRACKRCLPEAAPGSPQWNLRKDLAGRAMRLIADGVVDREGVDGLAARLGYSVRHVNRLLMDELGAGPLALARARRAQTARSLLVETGLPTADIAFASGFGSVRQFNDTMREVFDVRPGELRGLRRGGRQHNLSEGHDDAAGAAPGAGAVRLHVDLPVRQPYDAPGIFRFLAVRALPGVEAAQLNPGGPLRYARTLLLPHGPAAVDVTAQRASAGGWSLSARLELTALADVATAVARLRRLLDLDADPTAVDVALSADPLLAPLIAGTPGIRVPGAVDPHEMLIRAVIGQQISVAAARTHLARLAGALGAPYGSAVPGLDRLFPTPSSIAAAIPEPGEGSPDPGRLLRLPARSIRTVRGAALALAEDRLDVSVGADPDRLRSDLTALPGIGPWTAAYVAMRSLGDPDTWLDGDAALLAGARRLSALDPDLPRSAAHRTLTARAAVWAPWRSYAAMHLWQAPAVEPVERTSP